MYAELGTEQMWQLFFHRTALNWQTCLGIYTLGLAELANASTLRPLSTTVREPHFARALK